MGPQFFVDGGFVCTYKGITRLLGRGSVRITPAHAGKSQKPPGRWSPRRDHPRTRGEKRFAPRLMMASRGSPPHTRGKATLLGQGMLVYGITPARAGKSRTLPSLQNQCGERRPAYFLTPWRLGSPPRVRGKEESGDYQIEVVRITPARAGKSPLYIAGWKGGWDHPRACGEKYS